MFSSTQPLKGVRQVRGRKEDFQWFSKAVPYLLSENVDGDYARQAFEYVLSALTESHEPISELFGTPDKRARQ